MKRLLLALISIYQFLLSPWIGNQCRFYPTCSQYARLAIEHHGSLKGTWLALRRISRCHPWHPGGIDPVPDTFIDSQGNTRRIESSCETCHPKSNQQKEHS